jgi:hypothetical protein
VDDTTHCDDNLRLMTLRDDRSGSHYTIIFESVIEQF